MGGIGDFLFGTKSKYVDNPAWQEQLERMQAWQQGIQSQLGGAGSPFDTGAYVNRYNELLSGSLTDDIKAISDAYGQVRSRGLSEFDTQQNLLGRYGANRIERRGQEMNRYDLAQQNALKQLWNQYGQQRMQYAAPFIKEDVGAAYNWRNQLAQMDWLSQLAQFQSAGQARQYKEGSQGAFPVLAQTAASIFGSPSGNGGGGSSWDTWSQGYRI